MGEVKNKDYTGKNMKVLEGVAAVQKRPGMYLGHGQEGILQCFYEIFSNSLDEALAGYATKIRVIYHKDKSIQVIDNGRGIPTDEVDHKGKMIPACILSCTVLHSSGKFDDETYEVSGGTNGIGSTGTNALSAYYEVKIKRNGSHWKFRCENGKLVEGLHEIEKIGKKETGTSVRFLISDKYFEFDGHDVERIQEMIQYSAFLNQGIEITFTDKFNGTDKKTFFAKNGLKDFVNFIIEEKEKKIDKEAFFFEGEQFFPNPNDNTKEVRVTAKAAFTWTDSYEERCLSFCNGLQTKQHGTHVTGFRLSISKAILSYIEKNSLIPKKYKNLKLMGEDTREGLVVVINVNIKDAQLQGQTKESLGNREAQAIVQKLTGDFIKHLFESDSKMAKLICDKTINAAVAREASRKARDVIRKDFFGGFGMNLPAKLKDCLSNKPEECELFIVEGNSAGGSAANGRDRKTQAIMLLKGKCSNTYLMDESKLLDDEDIRNIILSVGTGYGRSFDISKLRYWKVVFTADSDVDGSHIASLLATLFIKHMPELIRRGHIYLAVSPLYIIKKGNKITGYLYSEDEKEDFILKRAKENLKLDKKTKFESLSNEMITESLQGIKLNYLKGLGEMNSEDLWETTLNPENRKLIQLTMENEEDALKTFDTLMSKHAIENRKALIMEKSHLAKIDGI